MQKNSPRRRRRKEVLDPLDPDDSAITSLSSSQPQPTDREYREDSLAVKDVSRYGELNDVPSLSKGRKGELEVKEWPGHWDRHSVSLPSVVDPRMSWATRTGDAQRLSYELQPMHGRIQSLPNDRASSPSSQDHFDSILLDCFHKAVGLVPSITFSIEADIWNNINHLITRWESILQSMLSFASTYMHFVTQDHLYARASIIYRGQALQALQNDMRASREGVDAAIAASILLADQAAFEGDWRASILHHRGLANLCMHHSTMATSSIFAKTRSFDPGKQLVQRRRIDTEAIQSTADGLGCYSSLQNLRQYFTLLPDRADMSKPDFVGITSASQLATIRDLQYSSGGLGHLLALACDVHKAHVDLCGSADASGEGGLLVQSLVLQYQEESNSWLTDVPQNVVGAAFEDDLSALVLLTYKFSLDLLLHRCTLLARGTSLLPPPAAVMAVEYIRFANEKVMSHTPGALSSQDHHLLKDAMNWPMWVLSWGKQFISREKIREVATESGLTVDSAFPNASVQQHQHQSRVS